ncbi:hypothetical protein KI387_016077, partial [Taxus chinensis]
DEKEGVTHSGKDLVGASADIHGVEPAEEFKPVEHPLEPPDKDQPVKCPPPEPSILHDGRIWKERREATARRQMGNGLQSQGLHRRRHTVSSEHLIVPSFSCPEHTILKLLDELHFWREAIKIGFTVLQDSIFGTKFIGLGLKRMLPLIALQNALGGKKDVFNRWDKEIRRRKEREATGGRGGTRGGGWFGDFGNEDSMKEI